MRNDNNNQNKMTEPASNGMSTVSFKAALEAPPSPPIPPRMLIRPAIKSLPRYKVCKVEMQRQIDAIKDIATMSTDTSIGSDSEHEQCDLDRDENKNDDGNHGRWEELSMADNKVCGESYLEEEKGEADVQHMWSSVDHCRKYMEYSEDEDDHGSNCQTLDQGNRRIDYSSTARVQDQVWFDPEEASRASQAAESKHDYASDDDQLLMQQPGWSSSYQQHRPGSNDSKNNYNNKHMHLERSATWMTPLDSKNPTQQEYEATSGTPSTPRYDHEVTPYSYHGGIPVDHEAPPFLPVVGWHRVSMQDQSSPTDGARFSNDSVNAVDSTPRRSDSDNQGIHFPSSVIKLQECDSKGRCIHHPHVRLRKKKRFGRGWKVLMSVCTECCLEEICRVNDEIEPQPQHDGHCQDIEGAILSPPQRSTPQDCCHRNINDGEKSRPQHRQSSGSSIVSTNTTNTTRTSMTAWTYPPTTSQRQNSTQWETVNLFHGDDNVARHPSDETASLAIESSQSWEIATQRRSSSNRSNSILHSSLMSLRDDNCCGSTRSRQLPVNINYQETSRRRNSKNTNNIILQSSLTSSCDGDIYDATLPCDDDSCRSTTSRQSPVCSNNYGSHGSLRRPACRIVSSQTSVRFENESSSGGSYQEVETSKNKSGDARLRDLQQQQQLTQKNRPVTMQAIQMPYINTKGRSGTYNGQVSESFVPHGRGTMVYDNGVVKDGEWKHGRYRHNSNGNISSDKSSRASSCGQSSSLMKVPVNGGVLK